MSKWIIFKADKGQPGSLDRSFSHTGSLTKILAEHFSYGDRDIPKVGYRLPVILFRTAISGIFHLGDEAK